MILPLSNLPTPFPFDPSNSDPSAFISYSFSKTIVQTPAQRGGGRGDVPRGKKGKNKRIKDKKKFLEYAISKLPNAINILYLALFLKSYSF